MCFVLFFSIYIMQDVALISLANVLYQSGFDKDTTAVIHMSLEVCQRTSSCEINSSTQRVANLAPSPGSCQFHKEKNTQKSLVCKIV